MTPSYLKRLIKLIAQVDLEHSKSIKDFFFNFIKTSESMIYLTVKREEFFVDIQIKFILYHLTY